MREKQFYRVGNGERVYKGNSQKKIKCLIQYENMLHPQGTQGDKNYKNELPILDW